MVNFEVVGLPWIAWSVNGLLTFGGVIVSSYSRSRSHCGMLALVWIRKEERNTILTVYNPSLYVTLNRISMFGCPAANLCLFIKTFFFEERCLCTSVTAWCNKRKWRVSNSEGPWDPWELKRVISMMGMRLRIEMFIWSYISENWSTMLRTDNDIGVAEHRHPEYKMLRKWDVSPQYRI